MSKGIACKCEGSKKEKLKNWVVVQFRCNYSAFNGYRHTPSDYSLVNCTACKSYWRTKADYVYDLKHQP